MWNFGKCCALGLPKKNVEEESEILTISDLSTISSGIEEEATDYDLIYDELEAMKQKLLLLRSKLIKTPVNKYQVRVKDGENSDEATSPAQHQLIILRRQNCVLRSQLHEMAKYLYTTQKDMKELEDWHCHLVEKLQKQRKELNKFEEVKANVIHHFGICIERWEQHKTSKVNMKFFMDIVCKFRNSLEGMYRGRVSLRCHQQLRYEVIMELILVRLLLCHLYESLVDNYNYIIRRMSTKCVPSNTSEFDDE